MTDLYFVTVNTRGKSSSDIRGYQEYISSARYFKKHIVGHPDAVCYKCKVAKLCGLDMKIYYFQNDEEYTLHDGAATVVRKEINRAASMLTLDPETGFAEHRIRGEAIVVLDDGAAPLSLNQVWGIQELINYAKDVYDSDHKHGRKELLKSCKLYRHKEWGPLSIYQNRPELCPTIAVASHSIAGRTKGSTRAPFQQIQV